MRNIATITWLTFHEARRRRMVLIALVLGALFLLLYALGFWMIMRQVRMSEMPDIAVDQGVNFLMLAGLYVVHFLTVMISIFASVDTISGEIASHTIQTIVTKPVRRWQIVLGKWLGYAAMISLYLTLLSGGIFLIVFLLASYTPSNVPQAMGLLILEALVLISLALLGGTRFSTLTNGVALFMLYGLAFIGAWVEQIGTLLQSDAAVNIGIISSLVLPVEALWRRSSYMLQPPLMRELPTGPFMTLSLPSTAMIVYAGGYALVMLALAMWAFGRRDL